MDTANTPCTASLLPNQNSKPDPVRHGAINKDGSEAHARLDNVCRGAADAFARYVCATTAPRHLCNTATRTHQQRWKQLEEVA